MTTHSSPHPRWVNGLSLVLLFALAPPALWLLFVYGYPRTHDGDLHLIRQALLDYYVHHGVWYPRWIPELFLGYGYPLFNFYGPATYYLGELFVLTGLSVAQALVAASALLVLGGGAGMVLFATDYFQSLQATHPRPTRWLPFWAGLIAGVAYLYAPYLLVNLYARGALGELGAMALWPWLLWSCRRLLTTDQPAQYTLLTGLSFGLMTITHTITLLLAPPIVLAYGIFLLWQRRKTSQLQPYLLHFGAALGLALSLSLFFWLPLFVERVDLSRLAYDARSMPGHFWDWNTFLDGTLRFVYTGNPPQQLGLVQLSLIVLGLFSFWRLGRESRFWLLIGGALIFAISRPAQPLWLNDIGLTIQFPWRLLGVLSFIFALITGATIVWLRRPWLQVAGAALVITLIILANQPQLAQLDFHNAQDVDITFDVVANFEHDSQAWGAGWSREFLPKWATAFARFAPGHRWEKQKSILTELKAPLNTAATPLSQLTLTTATPERITITAHADTTTQLQLNQFYFPGWQATDAEGHALAITPAPDTGFLTIAVPAGAQQITISREATPVERWAGWLTVAFLIGYAGWLLSKGRRIGQGLVVLMLVVISAGARWLPVMAAPSHFTPTTTTPYRGLELVGYRMETDHMGGLLLFPYWFVQGELPDLQMTWQVTEQSGAVVSSITGKPYYNTVPTSVWTAGTLVRDGYRLPLPLALAAGAYQLTVTVQPVEQKQDEATGIAASAVGTVTLATPLEPPTALQSLDLTFTQPQQVTAWLDGYTQSVQPNFFDWRPRAARSHYPLAYAGDRLVTRLYWRAEGAAQEGYHSFLHLVDQQRQTLVAQDQLAGSALNSSLTWNRYRAQDETYTLWLPTTAASGLYYPRLGLYTFAEQDRFTIADRAGSELGDGYDLPPIKIINRQDLRPLQPALVTFGDFARLIGVKLTPANQPLHAGDKIMVELTYQAVQSTGANYTQFVHLAQSTPAGVVMAAQFDVQPQQGANPTAAWVPGEVIADQLELTLAEALPPGRYQLMVGLYDSNGVRAVAVDANGNEFANDAAILDEIEVN